MKSSSATATPSAGAERLPKLKFNGSDRFLRELRRRVDAYFEATGRRQRDCPQMYFKTATILAWLVGAYLLLMFVVHSWWLILPLACVLGLSMAAVGFNIQHDAAHKAYSNRPWVNKLMAMTLDLVGGSSYLWDWKHNTIHHTYTNLAGYDDDINIGFWGRLAPDQKHYPFHRLQGIYLWVLYGFLALKWHLVDDFYSLITGKIGGHKVPRPKGKNLLVFIAGKVIFFSLAFVIPMILHPIWAVLIVYGTAAFVSGVVLSVVFQLAHCVEEADFPTPVANPAGGAKVENEWAIHQVLTTANFARRNKFLSWFLGGLNFQVEHHLFHKICHIHYPELSKVVEQVCREFGVRYNANKTFFGALRSHFRWLVQMGRPNVSAG